MGNLICTYIEKSDIGISDQLITFTNDFLIEIDQRSISIEKKEKRDNFYHNRISNINMLIGKNGSGKSSILEIISGSMPVTRRNKWRYLNVFHLYEDYYIVEGSTDSLVILGEIVYRNISNEKKATKSKYKSLLLRKGIFDWFEVSLDELDLLAEFDLKYQVLHPNIGWVNERRTIPRKIPMINKTISTGLHSGSVLSFVRNSNVVESKNFELTIKHAIDFPKNSPTLMYRLYQSNGNEEISNSSQKNVDQHSLTQREDPLNYYSENNVYFNEKYKRSNQDKNLSTKPSVYSYFLRLIEKLLLSRINQLTQSVEDNIGDAIGDDLYSALSQIRNNILPSNFQDDFKKETIKKRIEFCIQSYELVSKRLKKNEIDGKDIRDLWSLMKNLDDNRNFIDLNTLRIDLSDNNKVEDKLVEYFEDNSFNSLNVSFSKLSDGQLVYYNTFAEIYNALYSGRSNVILLLDEPDLNLHPEWSRTFIKNVIDLVGKSNAENVQIILSTHSPFMLTDVRRSDAYRIFSVNNECEKHHSKDKTKQKTVVKHVERSFASSIYELLANSFFLEKPIGEFAREKIEKEKHNEEFITQWVDDDFLKYHLTKKGDKYDKNTIRKD
ncbi:AAA family ATPase [Enterococcus casseliflavus]|uniref:AAA family ATPase n=1 Tax=Enterococcus casseliflavus TaxID=37734 RepID=UPI001432B1A5|nr:AAA family ATPase [Enterococcus casseliflavus]NKD33775.1 AAA family ATPase [Enterococcus casseliflavus]